MIRFITKQQVIIPIIVLTFSLMIAAGEFLAHHQRQHEIDAQKNDVLMRASLVRAKLEYEIHATLNLTMGLIAFVSSNPDFTAAEFTPMARELKQKAPHIRNIGLARDNVISHMYPLAGNEAALGLDYLQHPQQRDSVLRAIQQRNTVVAGPLDLVQGGQGFISRIPIYVGMTDRYWGIASIVIDVNTFYRNVGLYTPNSRLRFALRGKDALGDKGAHFFGDPDLFNTEDSVLLTIHLPVGSWQLAALPKGGLHQDLPSIILRFSGILLASIVSLLLYALLKSYRHIHHLALHDPLTRLTNRRFFDEYMQHSIATAQRTRDRFVLFYLDLDKFKPINDHYSHKKGDLVLSVVAERLRQSLRDSDMVSRIGGDEFVVMLPDPPSEQGLDKVEQKIRQAISQPIALDANTEVSIGVSIGKSCYPDDGLTTDALLKKADLDMYRNKKEQMDNA